MTQLHSDVRQTSSPAVVWLRVTEKSQVKMKELKRRLSHQFALDITFVHMTDDVEDVTFHHQAATHKFVLCSSQQ